MKISIGADHRGFVLKQTLIKYFSDIEWRDCGAYNNDRTDYPFFAKAASQEVLAGISSLGILICGSGTGMAIAANRFTGIYAGVCWNEETARVAREHDGTNILVLPADYVDLEAACRIVKAWLAAEFKGGRYQERLSMLDE